MRQKDLDPIRGRLMIRRDVDDLGHEDSTTTRNHQDVPIGGEILLLLDRNAQGKDPDAWLIPDERGKVWTTARWRVAWKNLCIWTEIGNLDHSSTAMTLDIYAHLWEEGLDALPGAMEAHMKSERKRAEEASTVHEVSEAERRRAQFKVIG